jgi:hypothetical protein
MIRIDHVHTQDRHVSIKPDGVAVNATRVCQRRSRDPMADGWIWKESTITGVKTGWRCSECMVGLQRFTAELV